MYVTSDAFWNPEVCPGCRLPGEGPPGTATANAAQ